MTHHPNKPVALFISTKVFCKRGSWAHHRGLARGI